ncbi:unnamed protein product [Cladocopium goreaui]|uniref:DnaJ protein homolog (DNAJ-1) n=1 Tax=Cladocopium goreaui TaxID=2562237 RepID=A0A9P1GPF2_9DINO|nr:unnamed protein product [Cladocopium goreaui]
MAFYVLLGVTGDTSTRDIDPWHWLQAEKAYRRRAAQAHPDKGGDAAEFCELTLAQDVLTDTLRRRAYDTEIRLGLQTRVPKFAPRPDRPVTLGALGCGEVKSTSFIRVGDHRDPEGSTAMERTSGWHSRVLCLGSGARATGVLNWRMADQQFDSSQEFL